ncbi:MAG: GIY-YIG nuclease family protein, partial [Minisyncoccia bacterium]
MKEYRYFVYIMTNKNDNVLYIGVTNNLIRRIYEHRGKLTSGFTEKYNCTKLIYFEETNNCILKFYVVENAALPKQFAFSKP